MKSIGDPRQLVHPTDSQGHLCGSGLYADRPYLYFFDWTKCIQSLSISTNLLKGRPFVCPTTQVCVTQCPTQTSYYKFSNYQANRVCTYDVDETQTNNAELVNAGKCATYIIASKPLFGRCVPEQLQSLANSIIQVRIRFLIEDKRNVFSFRHRMVLDKMKLYLTQLDKH
jgi:choline transporter-like protein 2/4/5